MVLYMVLYMYCMFFFRPAGRKKNIQKQKSVLRLRLAACVRRGDMMQPGVDIDCLAGDGGGPIAAQPGRQLAHILDRHAAAQWRDTGEVLMPRAEAGDA